jgi:hypothetical protein
MPAERSVFGRGGEQLVRLRHAAAVEGEEAPLDRRRGRPGELLVEERAQERLVGRAARLERVGAVPAHQARDDRVGAQEVAAGGLAVVGEPALSELDGHR